MANTPTETDLEKQATVLSFSPENDAADRSPAPESSAARARERMRNFLHPDGKRIHIASSPEEAANLRRRLERVHTADDFDIYISGTPEHLEALRRARTFHEDQRELLRSKNQEVYDRFAHVQSELDVLASELERVTSHGVSLDAHFSRFGYNAHVRSYNDDSPSQSGASTPNPSLRDKKESPCERGFATQLKLFKTPVLRQYFHKGILWRSSDAEEVQSFELFVDLLYVGIIAVNGDAASEDPTGLSLLRFVVTFALSFKIWNDMALLISWFETDDVFQRISILFLLACLFGYTTNITESFDTTYATLIGFYLAARFYMGLYVLLVAYLLPTIRPLMFLQCATFVIGGVLWIGSIHTPWPAQLALIWVAICTDVVGPTAHVFLAMFCNKLGPKAKEWFEKTFEFIPALNIEHRTERTNAFVTLVFGYTVVAILYQSSVNGIDAFFGKGILGLIQAFVFNWLYFEVDSANLQMHAIRRHKLSAFAWTMSHLPFIMAFVLAGGALARLVVATDTTDARLDSLTEEYQARSEPDIHAGIRWFYCGGLGVALLFMGLISISHIHKDVEGLRMTKKHRLAGRFVVAIIFICLPLATHLDSLELVATVTCLIVAVLMLELWATSSCHDRLFGRAKACRYTGQCGKKSVQALLDGGHDFTLDELQADKERDAGVTIGP